MRAHFPMALAASCLLWGASSLFAQTTGEEPAANLTSKSVPAIGYEIGGSTKINLAGTSAASQASGEAKVEAKQSGTSIDVKLKGMPQANTLGPEFLTYVLWAVTPDGGVRNLGEIPINKNGEGKIEANTASQTFSLVVTAEPYYAVRIPSELVILQNEKKKNTKGKLYPDTNYKLMFKGEYAKTVIRWL